MLTTTHISWLKSLNVNKNRKYWSDETRYAAPHKPLLILSVVDGLEQGWIHSPNIVLSTHLVNTFFYYWDELIGRDQHTTIALPYFHMKSEPFWKLKYHAQANPYSYSPSLSGLQSRVEHAIVDDGLFEVFQHPEGRMEIRTLLTGTYFKGALKSKLYELIELNQDAAVYSQTLFDQAAAEPFVAYHSDKHKKTTTTQTTIARDRGFSMTIRTIYDDRCTICKNRVVTKEGYSMVDGAHIIPFNKSYNDDPRNGLSLCKTHHWMYDHFMISIDPDYRIQLSDELKSSFNHAPDTLRRQQEEILLPVNEQYIPAEEAIRSHFEHFNTYNSTR